MGLWELFVMEGLVQSRTFTTIVSDIMQETALTPYQLLTSLRYDPFLISLNWNNDKHGPSPFFLLPLHLERLISAAETHNWFYARSLLKYEYLKECCLDAISEQRIKGSTSISYRLRITVSKEGRIVAVATPLPTSIFSDPTLVPSENPTDGQESLYGPTVRVYIDKGPIRPSVFTTTKTTLRKIYDDAKERNKAQGGETDEVPWDTLLYNEEFQITETTIFNVSFYRSSKWITPSTSTGCLPGVMRNWLLKHGQITEDTEGVLTKDSIQQGEWVLLCNGVQGCRLGKICI